MKSNSSHFSDRQEIFELAKEHFQENRLGQAEALLQQLILKDNRNPEVFQMLGTIYYDKGKFNKAIRSFRRALELAPGFTDASVGLSIVLNDIGRYDEGQEVFIKAQAQLEVSQSVESDPYIQERLAQKHEELAQLYFQCKRYKEALEQFYKALGLSTRSPELTMKIVECFCQLEMRDKAIKELHSLVQDYPQFTNARLRLGVLNYEAGNITHAVEQWEAILLRDSENPEAKKYIRIAQESGMNPPLEERP